MRMKKLIPFLALALLLSSCSIFSGPNGDTSGVESSSEPPSSQSASEASSAAPPSSSPSSATEAVLTEEHKASFLASVNEILDNYRNGSYPHDIIYYSEYFMNDAFPSDSEIPAAVSWGDLTVISYLPGEYMGLTATLPLKNEYAMELYGETTVSQIAFRDLRGAVAKPDAAKPNGSFSAFLQDRLLTTLNFSNLKLPKLPQQNEGSLRWESANERLLVTLNYNSEDSAYFDYYPATGAAHMMGFSGESEWDEAQMADVGKSCKAFLDDAAKS